jgi:hypothetical protein
VARKERNHTTQCSFTHFLAIGQTGCPGHATANPLLTGFTSGEPSFAMLATQLKAASRSISHCLRRGEAFSVAPQFFFFFKDER